MDSTQIVNFIKQQKDKIKADLDMLEVMMRKKQSDYLDLEATIRMFDDNLDKAVEANGNKPIVIDATEGLLDED